MNADHVHARRFAPVAQTYDGRDCALYALALGFGSDPLDERALRYVVDGPAQRIVPSWCVTLAWPPFWQRELETGIDWMRILHGEQHLELHRPIPLQTTVRATHRIAGIDDKGAGRGALVHFDTELHSATGATHFASLKSVHFLRGDGGCGSRGDARPGLPALPADAAPDACVDYPTATQAALLYRLASRDLMPLHVDPAVARAAGFKPTAWPAARSSSAMRPTPPSACARWPRASRNRPIQATPSASSCSMPATATCASRHGPSSAMSSC